MHKNAFERGHEQIALQEKRMKTGICVLMTLLVLGVYSAVNLLPGPGNRKRPPGVPWVYDDLYPAFIPGVPVIFQGSVTVRCW